MIYLHKILPILFIPISIIICLLTWGVVKKRRTPIILAMMMLVVTICLGGLGVFNQGARGEKLGPFNKEVGGVLRWFKGKQLLADVRGGDYAHAGEEAAIKKVFARFRKNKNRSILDVGSGRGGTADFIQKFGWGVVTGIDIEKESIQYAQSKYPKIKFYVADACSENELKAVLHEQKFDVITLFHSLCVFPKQTDALKALRKFAHNNTKLVIFEYEDLSPNGSPLNRTTDVKTYFKVNSRSQFKNMLREAGWYIDDRNIIDISNDFRKWYEALVNKLEKKKSIIIDKYGTEYYEKAKKRYGGMVSAINQGVLGGCILYASSSPGSIANGSVL